MMISKMQTYFFDKMLQKVKMKNKKCDLAKLENGFLILTFQWAF
jgi:hypothetical protein